MTVQTIAVGIASGVILLVLFWRVWLMFRPRASWLDRPVVFFLMIFLSLLVTRLPEIQSKKELNPDESQMLAQAMRYLSHPVPWRDVDGTTSGPLNSMLLSVPLFFGAPVSWVTTRTTLWAAQCLTLVFIYLALRCFATRAEAQFGLLPTILFYGFIVDPDFVPYSSETLPVPLLAGCIYLLCRQWVAKEGSRWRLFCLGLFSGCIPFTKLQAAPLALFLLLVAVALIVARSRKNKGARKTGAKEIGGLCLGAATVPGLMMGAVAGTGALGDFWKSYIEAPSAYAHGGHLSKFDVLWALFTLDSGYKSYSISLLVAGALLAIVACGVEKPKAGDGLFWPLMVLLALEGITIVCIVAAGWPWAHYLLLLVPTQAVLFGIIFFTGKGLLSPESRSGQQTFPVTEKYFLGACALAACLQACEVPGRFYIHYANISLETGQKKSYVARRIAKVSRPGDTMSVWGWMPSYYTETRLMPATRDAICHFIIEDGPLKSYYEQRYLNDLKRGKPAIFVDAIAKGNFMWSWNEEQAHESFPELAWYIDQNYNLWLRVYLITPWGRGAPVRIYLWKQRMAELQLKQEEVNIPLDRSLAPE